MPRTYEGKRSNKNRNIMAIIIIIIIIMIIIILKCDGNYKMTRPYEGKTINSSRAQQSTT